MEDSQKIAIVTGASRNIGAAIAIALAGRGMTVLVNYLKNEKAAKEVVQRIEAAGGRASAFAADVRDRGQVREMFRHATGKYGGLDVLVNNARLPHGRKGFLDTDWEADILPQLNIHFGGAFHCIQEAIPLMKARGGGSIVNILSWVFRVGSPNSHAYAPAKAALRSLTISLAAEMGPFQIRANSVSPGTTDTPEVHSRVSEEEWARRIARVPLGRNAHVEDIGGAVAFLCSEDARYITGEDITVAGGLAAGL
ncbi:MAG: SDR family oxidoreductase [bacterium]|nr:SDR family oxidoreductase [bacterium]